MEVVFLVVNIQIVYMVSLGRLMEDMSPQRAVIV